MLVMLLLLGSFICRIPTKPVEPIWTGGIYLEPCGSHETNPFPPVVEIKRVEWPPKTGEAGLDTVSRV